MLDVAQKLLWGPIEPDAGTEFRVVRQADLESKAFTVVFGKFFLYFVDDRYIGNRGSLNAITPLALLSLIHI